MTEHFYTKTRKIDLHLSVPFNTNSFKEVMELIGSDMDLRDYFFSVITRPDWFMALKGENYFSGDNNPGPKEDPENKGFFSIPEWSVLPYLQKVAENASEIRDASIAKELVEIIKEVSNPGDGSTSPDNPRTWWYFVKILVALPNEYIPQEIFSLVPRWLDSKFHMSLADSEICEKLLPKFLKSPPVHKDDYKKSEEIIEQLTSLKEKKIETENVDGTKRIRTEIKLAVDEYWLTDTIVRRKVGERIGQVCSEKVVYIVAKRLLELIGLLKFRGEPHVINETISSGQLWISILPDVTGKFTVKIFESDPRSKHAVPIKTAKSSGSLTAPDQLFKFFDDEIFNEERYKELKDKINLIETFFRFFDDNSHIWVSSFDDRYHDIERDSEHALALILLEILVGRARVSEEVHVSATKNIVENFLFNKYRPSIFTRLALYTINQNWDKLYSVFDDFLKRPYCRYYFDNPEYEAELYQILESQTQANKLSDATLNILETIFEDGPVLGRSSDTATDYWKQKWFSALKSLERFSKRYDELRNKTNIKEELDSRSTRFRIGPGESPKTIQEINKMPNDELVQFMGGFRDTDTWKEPTVNALADSFGLAVRENPEKFVSDITPFGNSSFLYSYKLVVGLREAWKNKKTFSWKIVLGFLLNYLENEKFWKDDLKTPDDSWNCDHRWIVSEIGWLLQEATLDDDWAMPKSCNDNAEVLIRMILERLKSEHSPDQIHKDPVNDTLNATHGKVLTALVYLSLRDARLRFGANSTKTEVRWKETLQAIYDGTLNNKIPESYVLTGQYMAQFAFLNKDWIDSKVTNFETLEDDYWYLFMYGYMFGAHRYSNLYTEMKNHYVRALSQENIEENWTELLLDHVALGYMSNLPGFGLSNNDLLGQLVTNWEPKKLRRIVEVFWRQPRYDSKSEDPKESIPAEKFFSLWKVVHERLSVPDVVNKLSEDEKVLLSELLKLTMWMPDLTKEFANWLIQGAPFVHKRYNSADFVEYLSYLTNKGKTPPNDKAQYLARIYLEMLKGYVPDHRREHIKEIISFLYTNGDSDTKEKANDIVEVYARTGLHFLQELWEEHNSRS